MTDSHRPLPIRTDPDSAFAHHTMSVRVPGIIRDIQAKNPDYPEAIQQTLGAMAEGMQNNDPIPMIDLPAPDYEEWSQSHAEHDGEPWLDTEWFYAELICYRLVIQAVRWWETGRDPFAPQKAAELEGSTFQPLLARALMIDGSIEERLSRLIQYTLWGNRIDLSLVAAVKHGGESTNPDDLLVDDTRLAVDHLLRSTGTIHVVADNAGLELAMDLVLIDTLLLDVTDSVVLHLKMHPTFVSDATPVDTLSFIDRLISDHYGSLATAFGQRLKTALNDGQLRLAPDLYWNSSRMLWDTPRRLQALFQKASLVILKGDANYRRLTGDATWLPETPFLDAAGYFPAPLLALRTMKSDVIVGLPAGKADELQAVDETWRTNGRYGVIQSNLHRYVNR
jgi:uncharacterized protein with ATP-grasp and redox domains